MTVQDASNKVQYTGDGVFVGPYNFAFQTLEEWIEVFVGGNLISDTLYTLNINVDQDTSPGGNVVFDTAVGDGLSIVILRTAPLDQESEYNAFDPFPSARVESDFDKSIIIDQQLQEEIDRSLKFAIDVSNDAELPAAIPLGFWRWDSAGTVIEYVDLTQTGTPTDSSVISYDAGNNFANGGTRTQEDKNKDLISVADFSGAKTGLVLQACFDSITSGTILIPAVVYDCSDINELNLQNGVSISAYGAVLDFSGSTEFNHSRVRLTGTIDSPVILTADALSQDTTISLSSVAGLAEAELLILSSDALVELNTIGGSTTQTVGEWVRVRSIAGLIVTLYGKLEGSYTTADNAKIEKVNTHKGSSIRGLGIIGKGTLGTGASSLEVGIRGLYCENVTIEDCDIKFVDYQQIVFDQTYGFKAYNNNCLFNYRGSESFTDVIQYGIAIKNVSAHGHVYHNTIEGGRHGVVFTENSRGGIGRDVLIDFNIITRTYAAAIATHESNTRFSAIGNHISNCVRGFDIRVRNFNLENNTIWDSIAEAIFLGEAVSRGQILNNDISGGTFGVRMNDTGLVSGSNPVDIQILINRIVNMSNQGISLLNGQNQMEMGGWVVSNNNIKNSAGNFIDIDGTFRMMKLSNNNLNNDAGVGGFFGIDIAGTSGTIVSNNDFVKVLPVRVKNDTFGTPAANPHLINNFWDDAGSFTSNTSSTNLVEAGNLQLLP